MPVNDSPRSGFEVTPEIGSQVASRKHDLSTRQRPMCRVSNGARLPASPDAGLQAILRSQPYLTGTYVEEEGRYHLFVNQANLHLEVMVAIMDHGITPKVTEKKDGRIKESLFHLQGDLVEDDFDTDPDAVTSFVLTTSWDLEHFVGRLVVLEPDGARLRLKLDPALDASKKLKALSGTNLRRVSDRPVLFERALLHDTVPTKLRTWHWWPLTPQQSRFLASDFVFTTKDEVHTNLGRRTMNLLELVDHYYEQERQAPRHLVHDVNHKNAEAIDELLGEVISEAYARTPQRGGIHEAHFDVLYAMVRFHLGAKEVKPAPDASARPLTDLLQEIANANGRARLTRLEKFGFASDDAQCRFKVSYDVVGGSAELGVGWGAWLGTITFTPLEGAGWDKPVTYELALASMTVGLGAGASAVKTGTGSAVSGNVWRPEHIPGPVSGADTSSSAGGGVVGAEIGLGFLRVEGVPSKGSPRTPLMCNFSPLDWEKWTEVFNSGGTLGYSIIETTWTKGKISPLGAGLTRKDATALLPKMSDVNYTSYLKRKTSIHYCTNDAQLRPDARRMLDMLAALELAAFSAGGSRLRIGGWADRVGTPEANEELARARALNVETYLRDILVRLSDRGALDIAISAAPGGEIKKGPDEVENPAYRRTDLWLDGKLLLVLEGVPDGVPAE